nr:MAG TPA: hypothetical protein [Crassvirales sp.]DAP16705.1 MAG TPA: hypothetical protein [Caudoviricetes sp.]
MSLKKLDKVSTLELEYGYTKGCAVSVLINFYKSAIRLTAPSNPTFIVLLPVYLLHITSI